MSKLFRIFLIGMLPVLFVSISSHTAKSESLTWYIKSKYPYKVNVSFYSKRRNFSWPGGTKVWVISDSKVHEYTLSCRRGEKICFGAWVRGTKRKYWGVGHRGRKGCRKCCYTCNGGESKIQTLRR